MFLQCVLCSQFIFYVQIISLLTMGINSYLMSESARLLGKVFVTFADCLGRKTQAIVAGSHGDMPCGA